MDNTPTNVIRQINDWSEHQLIWHGVCVWLYPELESRFDDWQPNMDEWTYSDLED